MSGYMVPAISCDEPGCYSDRFQVPGVDSVEAVRAWAQQFANWTQDGDQDYCGHHAARYRGHSHH